VPAAAPSPPLPLPAPANNHQPEAVLGHGPPADEATQVLLRFQDLMARFLDTQKSVMTSYLQGTGAAPDLTAALSGSAASALLRGGAPQGKSVPTTANGQPAQQPPPSPPKEPTAEAHNGSGEPRADAPAENHLAVAAAPGSPKTRDRGWLTNRLQEVVSQRTGYAKEMLSLDVNLEADLGIDSIKRVEILSEVAADLGDTGQSLPAGIEMEKLTTLSTLRGIIDYLGAALTATAAKLTAANGTAAPAVNGPAPGKMLSVQRGLVALVEAPLSGSADTLPARGVVLLTDDGRGVAQEVADRLADLGQRTILLRTPGGAETEPAPGVFEADLTDPQAVADLLGRIKEEAGNITGLMHLLPLAEPTEGETWDQRARREVKSLYLLARALGNEWQRASPEENLFLLAATALGGGFGFSDGPLPEDYSPGHGGVLGFVKCLAAEWPAVLVRGVDLEAESASAVELAQRLLDELGERTGPVEVGYRDGRRLTWGPRAAPLTPDEDSEPLLEPGEAVLITGGARGITAVVALELARRYRPTLLLVGRSPLPPEKEPAETATLTTPAMIKTALLDQLEREGRPLSTALVEARYRRLLQDREIRGNLARLRETGAAVHYFSVDVRDEAAFGKLLEEVQQRFGPLAGVIHGAGVIEDRLVRDKTPESFDRVFETKVVSSRILSERLQAERLRFCVFFASVASRYGNKGQADYAAANEVLSKLALQLDQSWAARVVSIAWGPWSGIGMVAELEKHLVQRGLRLIAPDEGPALLIAELLHGRKGESEVILAGGAEALAQPAGQVALASG
jgi:NAD(P)-dependent dehydrogenase (short-subunit alcohol dehydrogenase family)